MTTTDEKTTASVKAAKRPPADGSTQRYLPFSEIRDNMIVMKDGSARMVLRIRAINFHLKNEQEQDSIIIGYQRFLNSLRFPVQVIIRSVKVDLEGYMQKLKTIAVRQQNQLMQEQTYRYIDFLNNLVDLAQIMRKDFFIVVPFDYDSDTSVRRIGFVGYFQNFWSAISGEESIGSVREKRRKVDALRKGAYERTSTVQSALE
jgi:hypothetical protein